MAEPAIAVDPQNPQRVAVAADPYLSPVRIQVTRSNDGGETWGAAVDILPPGFAKSYDPSLAFGADGRLLVVGGASRAGPPSCQPGSAIFQAVVAGSSVSYALVRDAHTDGGVYVDRPRFSYFARRSFLTWTESSGPRAECRGIPLKSTTMFTRSAATRGFEAPRALPSSGFRAPFGTSRPVVAGGRLRMVVGEHDGAGRSRAVLVTSNDDGATFEPAIIVWEGATTPLRLDQLGGIVAPLPSLAVRGDDLAVAWSRARGTRAQLVVAESNDGVRWHDVSPPATPPLVSEVFGEVAMDQRGGVWLVAARIGHGSATFALRRHTAAWSTPVVVASGSSTAYLELGQTLGLAVSKTTVHVAVPVDGPTDATLAAVTYPFPPEARPPVRAARKRTGGPAPFSQPNKARRATASRRPLGRDNAVTIPVAALGGGVVLVVGGLARWHKRNRPERLKPPVRAPGSGRADGEHGE